MKKVMYSLLSYSFFLVVCFPLLLLVMWSVTARMPWPQLFPTSFSQRGIQELLRPGNQLPRLLISSVSLSLGVAIWSVVVAFLTSRALLKISKFLRKIIIVLALLPMFVPGTVFGMGIHTTLIQLGLTSRPIGVMLVHSIFTIPYATILLVNGAEQLGTKLEETAKTSGASIWQTFSKVTFPLLLPEILSALMMSYIVSFSQYFLTLIIGGGKVKTFALIMYPYLESNDRTIASLFGLVFLLFTLVIFVLMRFLSEHYQKHQLNQLAKEGN